MTITMWDFMERQSKPGVCTRRLPKTDFRTGLLIAVFLTAALPATAQLGTGSMSSSNSESSSSSAPVAPQPPPQSAFQGSVVTQQPTPGVMQLTIRDAVLTGLKNN